MNIALRLLCGSALMYYPWAKAICEALPGFPGTLVVAFIAICLGGKALFNQNLIPKLGI